eukprot:11986381-Ditylum_brightwellii.AAC.1
MELRDVLAIVDVKNNKEVKNWKDSNNIGDMKEGNIIPKISLLMWSYKFGNNPNRVEAILLAIRAKTKDAVYLKRLMPAAYKQEEFDCGIFMPYGVHIKEGTKFLKNLL